jgi:hypothetical protein
MTGVDSSMMTDVAYDEDSGELDITFTSGKTYRYLNVPPDIHAGLLEAESKGQYFNDYIKYEFVWSEVTRRRPR